MIDVVIINTTTERKNNLVIERVNAVAHVKKGIWSLGPDTQNSLPEHIIPEKIQKFSKSYGEKTRKGTLLQYLKIHNS